MHTQVINTQSELLDLAHHMLESVAHDATHASVLALYGDLGAGKTTFVQYLAQAIGVVETVTSPTFVIQKQYPTTHPVFSQLVHIDAYRLESANALTVLGFANLLADPRNCICIEWAERVLELLPEQTIHIRFAMNDNEKHTVSWEV